jgi:putative ABC transport system permease protein
MIAVNLSALLLARANERERESALRTALGATTGSLIRLYLAETFLLTFAGAAIGLLLALSGVDFLKTVLPSGISRLDQARVDWRVLGCGIGLAFAVSLIAGLIPSWMAASNASLKDDGRTTASKQGMWIRSGFVIAEIALGFLLVTTAVRMAETFVAVSERSRAIQTTQRVAVTVPFSWTDKDERVTGFNKAALERFAAMPGVTAVGLIDRLPLGGGTQSGEIEISGINPVGSMNTGRRSASSSYFAAMAIPLLRGRLFEDRAKRDEVVVNETFVRRFLNGADPVGRKVKFSRGKEWLEIVGVVGNIRQQPEQREAEPEMFLFYEDAGWPISNFVIRSTAPLSVLAPMIRQEVGRLDSMVVIDRLSTLDDALGEATATPRIRSYMIGSFALLALFLAAIGIHGLFAADVARRWKEFGIRLALGGSVPGLRTMMLKRAAWLVAGGSVLGIAAVLGTSKLLESAVEGLQPARLATGAIVTVLILCAALAAIWWPLRKLAGVDPASALRHE